MTSRMFERRGMLGNPALDPALNAPLVAYLATDRAGHVNGQIFGRSGFGFTFFQTPRPVANDVAARRLDARTDRRPLRRGARGPPPACRHGRHQVRFTTWVDPLRPMRLNVHLVRFPWRGRDRDRDGLIRAAQAAESVGANGISFMDHFFGPPARGPADDPMLEGYTPSVSSPA